MLQIVKMSAPLPHFAVGWRKDTGNHNFASLPVFGDLVELLPDEELAARRAARAEITEDVMICPTVFDIEFVGGKRALYIKREHLKTFWETLADGRSD
jgi:hypothetical protein